jgi:hypothetical protein
VLFTLPHELNSLVMGHRVLLYKLLFDASAQTLLLFAADQKYLGATPGIISVLHTWGQQLSFHPHVHCIISGGGIESDNSWKNGKKTDWQFLFPVKAMSIVYRAKFLQALQQLINKAEVTAQPDVDVKQLISQLYHKDWIVYAKAPFGGPHAVVEYLGRYTHKVAISNHRLCAISEADDTVTFGYKDYADDSKQKQMTLGCPEFIRRFEQHILPKRFTKIRTYGYLSNRNRHQRINAVLKKMKLPLHKGLVKIPLEVRMKEQYGLTLNKCPGCGKNSMELLHIFYPFGNRTVKKRADDG